MLPELYFDIFYIILTHFYKTFFAPDAAARSRERLE